MQAVPVAAVCLGRAQEAAVAAAQHQSAGHQLLPLAVTVAMQY